MDPIARAELRFKEISAPAGDWGELRAQYQDLRATLGPLLWESPAGRRLALDIEEVSVKFGALAIGDAIFSAPKMLGVYWDLLGESEMGARNLLIVGERGTGKKEIAKVLASHLQKERQAFNCAMLPQDIVVARLFGGSGEQGGEGVVHRARGGVLLLEEFFNAPPSVLPQLLRLLQQRMFCRVDGREEMLEDTTIVAASSRYPSRHALESAGHKGDEYARLADCFDSIIEVPPLRDRINEIPKLAEHVLKKLRKDAIDSGERLPWKLSWDTHLALLDHEFSWPGNLRQLHWFVREQVKLRLGSPHNGELDIPKSVLEKWLPASAPGAATMLRDNDNPLFAWDRDGVRRLREEQLLAVLRDEVRREDLSPGSLDVSWVTEQCKRLLGAKNPSQKLLDNVGKDAHEILSALQISLSRG